MNVVRFPTRAVAAPNGWQSGEFQQIVAACSGSMSLGEASGWEIGTTEHGDPQVYLIGPPPDYDCVLCISRVAGHYVIEDGQGYPGLLAGYREPLGSVPSGNWSTATVTPVRRFLANPCP